MLIHASIPYFGLQLALGRVYGLSQHIDAGNQKCSNKSATKGRAANEKSGRRTMSSTQLANPTVRYRHSLSNFGKVWVVWILHSYPSCNKSRSIKQSLFTLRDPKSSLLVNLSSFPPDPRRHFSVWSLTFHISSNLLASYLYWNLNLIINQLQIDFSSSFSLPQLLGYF